LYRTGSMPMLLGYLPEIPTSLRNSSGHGELICNSLAGSDHV
jgi:hypothetical protein